MNTLWQDLRYRARIILNNPSLTIITITALAFGACANTAILRVINSILLHPLNNALRIVISVPRWLFEGS
jgi:hypothetical protein